MAKNEIKTVEENNIIEMVETKSVIEDIPEKKIENNQLVDSQFLIQKAIEQDLDIEKMERLLVMRDRIQAEISRNAYFNSLSKFQKDCPVIIKTKAVYNKKNILRYLYAPLDSILSQVKEPLERHGFSFNFQIEQDRTFVKVICTSNHFLGHSEQTSFTIPIDPDAYMNPAQKVASALTFAKRYAFCNAFGIMSGDDDDSTGTEDSPKTGSPYPNQSQGANYNTVPEENQALYQAIMTFMREKQDGVFLFNDSEKIDLKSKADIAIANLEDLKKLYSVANKVGQDRRKKIREKRFDYGDQNT